MSPEEERQLVMDAQAGNRDALARLIAQHERFLWKLARSTIARGMTLDDLYQTSVVEFINAVMRFKLERNVRLTTFVYRCVPDRVFNEANSQGVVRIPYIQKHNLKLKQLGLLARHVQGIPDGRLRRLERPSDCDAGLIISDDHELLQRSLRWLTDKERAVIDEYLKGYRKYEIAKRLGISRQRVDQLFGDAIDRIRRMNSIDVDS